MGTGFERSPGPGDEDFVVVDNDFRHENSEVSAPQFGIGAGDFGAKALTEPLDRGIVDPSRLATDLLRELRSVSESAAIDARASASFAANTGSRGLMIYSATRSSKRLNRASAAIRSRRTRS